MRGASALLALSRLSSGPPSWDTDAVPPAVMWYQHIVNLLLVLMVLSQSGS